MRVKASRSVCLLLVLAGILPGCNRVEHDWRKAQAADTVTSYEQFLARHPNGQFVELGRKRIVELKWAAAVRENTAAGYEMFVKEFPSSPEAEEAKRHLVELEWELATREATVEALEGFDKKWPSSGRSIEVREKVRALKELILGSRLVELTFLEWIAFGGIQARINNQALLKQSAFAASDTMIMKVGQLEWKRIRNGIGFEFVQRWDSPYVVAGNHLPDVAFRNGWIAIINGDVQYGEGLQVKVAGRIVDFKDESIGLVPSETAALLYSFRSGKWVKS